MNRSRHIHRLFGPAFLILFGITCLLHQWRALSFGQSWPLYLILAGLLLLAKWVAALPPKLPDESTQTAVFSDAENKRNGGA